MKERATMVVVAVVHVRFVHALRHTFNILKNTPKTWYTFTIP